MSKRMPTHIQLGVISRTKLASARAVQAYNMCARGYDITGATIDFSKYKHQHVGTAILLPRGSTAKLLDPTVFIEAIEKSEVRVDAQEARTIQFDLPRGLSTELMMPVAAFVLAPFIQLGMAVQIDVECPRASDGGEHPHVHVLMAMRELCGDKFGKKVREWNSIFVVRNGRFVRGIIAARLTIAAAFVGLDTVADPRANLDCGRAPPQQRFARHMLPTSNNNMTKLLSGDNATRQSRELQSELERSTQEYLITHDALVHRLEFIPIWTVTENKLTAVSAVSVRDRLRKYRYIDGKIVVKWDARAKLLFIDDQSGILCEKIEDAVALISQVLANSQNCFFTACGSRLLLQAVGSTCCELDDPIAIIGSDGQRGWALDNTDKHLLQILDSFSSFVGSDNILDLIWANDSIQKREKSLDERRRSEIAEDSERVSSQNDFTQFESFPVLRRNNPVSAPAPSFWEHQERVQQLLNDRIENAFATNNSNLVALPGSTAVQMKKKPSV